MNKLLDLRRSMRHGGARATLHPWATRWAHWAAAGLLVFAAVRNGEDTGAFFDPSAMRVETLVGLGVAVLYGGLRLLIHRQGGGSRLPSDAPQWERRLSGLVHRGLYLGIVGALLSGLAMAALAPTDIVVDATSEQILHVTTRLALARTLHEASAGLLAWLFAAHAAGALWHRLVRRDGVLESISVFRRPGPLAKDRS